MDKGIKETPQIDAEFFMSVIFRRSVAIRVDFPPICISSPRFALRRFVIAYQVCYGLSRFITAYRGLLRRIRFVMAYHGVLRFVTVWCDVARHDLRFFVVSRRNGFDHLAFAKLVIRV